MEAGPGKSQCSPSLGYLLVEEGTRELQAADLCYGSLLYTVIIGISDSDTADACRGVAVRCEGDEVGMR